MNGFLPNYKQKITILKRKFTVWKAKMKKRNINDYLHAVLSIFFSWKAEKGDVYVIHFSVKIKIWMKTFTSIYLFLNQPVLLQILICMNENLCTNETCKTCVKKLMSG